MPARLAAIAGALLVLAACGSSSSTPPPEGGVVGQVTAGPTCPVERADQPCPPVPARVDVEAVDADGAVADSAATDGAGRYELELQPGSYTLHVRTDGPFPSCPDTPVTVRAGSAATVDIQCDTGIR